MSSPTRSSRSSLSPSRSSNASSSRTQSPILSIPTRPTRSEYASYSALLRDFDRRNHKPRLSERLITREVDIKQSRAAPTDREGDDAVSAGGADIDQVDQSEELGNDNEGEQEGEGTLNEKETDDRWPLAPSQLGQHPSLRETILTFASAYIRKNDLVPNGQRDWVVETGTNDDGPILPSDLVSSTIQLVDSILVGLAIMRPREMKSRRKELGTMDWKSVCSVAGTINNIQPTLMEANTRLRDIYKIEEPDLLAHRMSVVEKARSKSKLVSIHDLYEPITAPRPTRRAHQSEAEIARREEKRRIRLEKKRARDEAKAAEKQERAESRLAKKRKVDA